jgi:hypothetical protein
MASLATAIARLGNKQPDEIGQLSWEQARDLRAMDWLFSLDYLSIRFVADQRCIAAGIYSSRVSNCN